MESSGLRGWSFDPIEETDLDALLTIENSSFSRPWNRNAFVQELECDYSWNYALKYRSGTSLLIAGYVVFRIIMDEMQLFRIAVDKRWRKKGIADRMLEESICMATDMGADSVILEVRASNDPALRLYEKNEFRIAGKRPGYYPETREDALILKKTVRRH